MKITYRHKSGSAVAIDLLAVLVFCVGVFCYLGLRFNAVLVDPDTWMRLAYVEQCLTDYRTGFIDPAHPHARFFLSYLSEDWFRHDSAGMGSTPLHWTLPYDLFLTVLTLPFLLAGHSIHHALENVRLIAGPVSVLGVMFASWLLARACLPRAQARGAAPWLMLFTPVAAVTNAYGLPGRVSHHSFTLAVALFSLGCVLLFFRRPSRGHAVLAGMAIVMAMWTSIETLPFEFITLFVLWAGCLWRGHAPLLARRMNGFVLILFAVAFLGGVLALLLDAPVEGVFTPRTDRYSIVHVLTLPLAGVAATLCRAWACSRRGDAEKRFSSGRAFTVLCGVGLGFATLWVASVTLFALPPVNTADPVFRAYFFKDIQENLNVFRLSAGSLGSLLFPQIPALLVFALLLRRKTRRPQFWFLLIALMVFLGTEGLGAFAVRLRSYSGSLAAVICAISLRAFQQWRHRDVDGDLLISISAAFVGIGLLALTRTTPALVHASQDVEPCAVDDRLGGQIVQALGEGTNVMNDIWIGPVLLWHTLPAGGLNIVAGPYHPNKTGIHDTGVFWITPYATDRHVIDQILRSRRIGGVVACVHHGLVSGGRPAAGTIGDLILHDHLPVWLQRVPLTESGGVRAYRVIQPSIKD